MANCALCGRRLPALWFGKKICRWCVRHQQALRAQASGAGTEDAIQPLMAPPWLVQRRELPVSITQVLLGINVAVFLGMALATGSIDPTAEQLKHWGANYGPLTLGGEPWRLLTSCFQHGGILHIGLNMWCLWSLGQLAESLYGPWTYAGIYLVSGVASMLASAWWSFGVVSVGASGAIFGLAGALAASFYLGEFSLPRDAVKSQASSLVMFIGYNLIFGAVAGHIDNAAHIGGLVTGGILGALIARAAPDAELWYRRAAILAATLGVVAASAAGLQRSRGYLIHEQRGADFLKQGKFNEGLAELQLASRLRPGYLPTHLALAYGYAEQKNLPAATDELKQVIAVNPGFAPAYYELGTLYREMNRPVDARDEFLQLLKVDPNSADAHKGLGALRADGGQFSEALQEFQAAAALNPQLENIYYDMALCYSGLGDNDGAIAALKQQIEVSGEESDTEAALAAAYRAKGMTREAEAAERKVAKKTPTQ